MGAGGGGGGSERKATEKKRAESCEAPASVRDQELRSPGALRKRLGKGKDLEGIVSLEMLGGERITPPLPPRSALAEQAKERERENQIAP